MKTKLDEAFHIGLVAPPWWLIPSQNIVTATEHIVEDYAFNFRKQGYKSIIFSRKKDCTDKNGIKDSNKYNNTYSYTKVSQIDRRYFKQNASLFLYFLYILKISLKIRAYKIHRIIVFQTLSFCFWIKLLNPKTKILYYTPNHELSRNDNYYQYGSISDGLALRVFPKIDGIVTMSNYIRLGIVNRFPNIKQKCETIYIGIDTKLFQKSKKTSHKRIIVYSGRVVPEKGVHLLVNAFTNLSKEFSDLELYILGSDIGPTVPKDYFSIFNHRKITMFGLLPRVDVAKILSKASVFVYPVIWEEPFGLAPIEAMSVGIPTVVSDTNSGYKEILNSKNGYYFKSGDEKDLERVLRKVLLSSYKNKNQICQNAQKTIRYKLSWEKCIKETVKCFNGI